MRGLLRVVVSVICGLVQALAIVKLIVPAAVEQTPAVKAGAPAYVAWPHHAEKVALTWLNRIHLVDWTPRSLHHVVLNHATLSWVGVWALGALVAAALTGLLLGRPLDRLQANLAASIRFAGIVAVLALAVAGLIEVFNRGLPGWAFLVVGALALVLTGVVFTVSGMFEPLRERPMRPSAA